MTYEQLVANFVYEPDTGRLRRVGGVKDYPWRDIGSKRQYMATTFRGRTYYAHHLVWLWHHTQAPNGMLDHVDRDPRNNRIENLRECTNAQNQYNGARKRNNKSGFKGVAFCKGYRKPWRARIVVAKSVVELGHYDTPEEAAAAYAEGAARYAGAFAWGG